VNAAKGAAWAAPPKEEPASLPEKSEEDLRAAVRSHLPAAISTAARIASDVNQRPADQLAAAKLLMDFGLSRPQPPANARADLEHLRELAAFLRGDKPDSP
jgi:hypothetical protein